MGVAPLKIAATYVISLTDSERRWQDMQGLLAAGSFPRPVRWDATDGSRLSDADIRRLQDEGHLSTDLSAFNAPSRAGEIGCALSHAAVLREVVRNGLPAALILEDDIVLAGPPSDWAGRFLAAYEELPDDWDLWYLYRCLDIRHRVRRVSPRLLRPWSPLGCAAYAVTLDGARKLLEAIEPVGDAIDRAILDRAIRPGRAVAYAASPMLIEPSRHPSIINRGTPARRFVVDGVNLPPEYWPMKYYRYLGESHWRYWPPWKIALALGVVWFIARAVSGSPR